MLPFRELMATLFDLPGEQVGASGPERRSVSGCSTRAAQVLIDIAPDLIGTVLCDREGPADVQRRHRGELVGQPVAAGHRPVDGPAEAHPGVHEAMLRQHPRRGQRVDQVDHQRGRGDRGEHPAKPQVVPRAPHEQPGQAGDRGREVDPGVVRVRGADRQRPLQQPRLQVRLVRQLEAALDRPHLVGVEERVSGVLGGDEATDAVRTPEQREHNGFASSRRLSGGSPFTYTATEMERGRPPRSRRDRAVTPAHRHPIPVLDACRPAGKSTLRAL